MNILFADINENRRTDIPSLLEVFLRSFIRRWAACSPKRSGVGGFDVERWTFASISRPQSTAHSPQSSKSGIALVMVLGVLSVMVIMAVAFAISMRTERVAAGNHADSVRARQFVQVGLARALNDLAVQLGTNGLGSAVGGMNYPPWAVTNSFTNAYTNTSDRLYLVYATNDSTRANEATNFVPRALWDAALTADSLSAPNHWLPVEHVEYTNDLIGIPRPAATNIIARVKYLILNCSGLVDVNVAGCGPHGVGTNPVEIAIVDNLGDVSGPFVGKRLTDVRYETLAELNEWAAINKPATNLIVYSRSLPGYWNAGFPAGVGTQVNVSGAASNLIARQPQILNALTRMNFTASEAGILFDNLVDYVDIDNEPGNLQTCVEHVPMINEIVFTNSVSYSSGASATWTANCEVSFELWYPFVGSEGAYAFSAAVSFIPDVGVALVATNPPGNLYFSRSDPFRVVSFGVTHDYGEEPKNFRIRIDKAVVGDYPALAVVYDKLKVAPSFITASPGSMECLDPRFNYDLASTNNWRRGSVATLEETNQWTLNYFLSATDGETNTEMYVSNTNLLSVGELGYLAYAPWKTIKLYGPKLHPVLDVFGLSTNAGDEFVTNTVYCGRVNCNSNPALDATAVVFANMPADQYPYEFSNTVPMSFAREFASTIFGKGIFTNLSDVGRGLASADFPKARNELEREAYFRNACNLLNVRQNLFTIIIEAQVASGGNFPRNPVRQRAVALVWRDPYTGEMFVRSIKWLKD